MQFKYYSVVHQIQLTKNLINYNTWKEDTELRKKYFLLRETKISSIRNAMTTL
jgi:hypothetical protein